MNFKTVLLALVVFIGVFNINAASPATLYIRQIAEDALQAQMLKFRSEPKQVSDVSACLAHYSELFDTLLKNLEEDTKACRDTEVEKLLEIANTGQQSRDATTQSLKDLCKTIDGCIAKSENLDFFDCVDKSGDKNTRRVWSASKDSSENAASIREQIHVVKHETVVCTDKAERVYVSATAKATQDMMACYANGGIIPTTSTPELPLTQDP